VNHPAHDLSKVILALGYSVELIITVDSFHLSPVASSALFCAIAAPMIGIYSIADRILPTSRGNFAHGHIFPWWHHRSHSCAGTSCVEFAYTERAAA
jgi:hypothetical protein